jgi:hypothetical protein
MKVIVQEDHAIPNVAMYFFCKIGSRNLGNASKIRDSVKKYAPSIKEVSIKIPDLASSYLNRLR